MPPPPTYPIDMDSSCLPPTAPLRKRRLVAAQTGWKSMLVLFSSVSVGPTVCDPMDCSTPGLPVHHQLPEFTQTHVHRVGDAIQLSHPLSSPSSPAFNLSQHQGLFKWVSSSHQEAKVLESQHQPLQSLIIKRRPDRLNSWLIETW